MPIRLCFAVLTLCYLTAATGAQGWIVALSAPLAGGAGRQGASCAPQGCGCARHGDSDAACCCSGGRADRTGKHTGKPLPASRCFESGRCSSFPFDAGPLSPRPLAPHLILFPRPAIEVARPGGLARSESGALESVSSDPAEKVPIGC